MGPGQWPEVAVPAPGFTSTHLPAGDGRAGGGGHRAQQHLVRPACTLQRQGTHPCPGHGHSQDGGPRPGPASCVGPRVCSLCVLHTLQWASAPVSSARREHRPLLHTALSYQQGRPACRPWPGVQGLVRALSSDTGTGPPGSQGDVQTSFTPLWSHRKPSLSRAHHRPLGSGNNGADLRGPGRGPCQAFGSPSCSHLLLSCQRCCHPPAFRVRDTEGGLWQCQLCHIQP